MLVMLNILNKITNDYFLNGIKICFGNETYFKYVLNRY